MIISVGLKCLKFVSMDFFFLYPTVSNFLDTAMRNKWQLSLTLSSVPTAGKIIKTFISFQCHSKHTRQGMQNDNQLIEIAVIIGANLPRLLSTSSMILFLSFL